MVSAKFDSTRLHPRRRPVMNTSFPEVESSSSKMHLKKGETFNSPTSPPSHDNDPILDIRSLPRRSPTSLDAIALSEQNMASLLERLTLDDQRVGNSSSAAVLEASCSGKTLNAESEVAATPALEPASDDGNNRCLSVKKEQLHSEQDSEYDHESDSGLGSSISSRESLADETEKVNNDIRLEQSAITSPAALDEGSSPRRQLSYAACKQIERCILLPILKEPRLTSFFPLIKSIPSRIAHKQIVCLREVEKTLLWLAPKFCKSRSLYLSFCEFTIQCLHTSTSHLNDRDQRLPADRPYTNGYFLDLVSQVRRLAAMFENSRQQLEAGQGKSASPNFTVSLQGGLTVNGRPAELVVEKDGQLIGMADGQAYEPSAPPTTKRALFVEEAVDEGVMRSMARRKKNAPPMNINQKCSYCDKVFRRPCDLTKHEKTHTRPWKCPETDCKYHHIGWPTEKECERHYNDKHDDDPVVYLCGCPPCTYISKRESNCKQHMEKAHQFDYKRAKQGPGSQGPQRMVVTRLRSGLLSAMTNSPSASTPPSGQTGVSDSNAVTTSSETELAPESAQTGFGTPNAFGSYSPVASPAVNQVSYGSDHTSSHSGVGSPNTFHAYGSYSPVASPAVNQVSYDPVPASGHSIVGSPDAFHTHGSYSPVSTPAANHVPYGLVPASGHSDVGSSNGFPAHFNYAPQPTSAMGQHSWTTPAASTQTGVMTPDGSSAQFSYESQCAPVMSQSSWSPALAFGQTNTPSLDYSPAHSSYSPQSGPTAGRYPWSPASQQSPPSNGLGQFGTGIDSDPFFGYEADTTNGMTALTPPPEPVENLPWNRPTGNFAQMEALFGQGDPLSLVSPSELDAMVNQAIATMQVQARVQPAFNPAAQADFQLFYTNNTKSGDEPGPGVDNHQAFSD